MTLENAVPPNSGLERPRHSSQPLGSEHYHAGMKKEHPDWNFCPSCNASLLEPLKSETFSVLLSSVDNSLLISIALSPELGTGTLSPFSLDETKKIPVWAEATHLGSQGLARQRLFEETVVQHIIPAFKNGFKLAKYAGTETDLYLFMQVLTKYSQRELAQQSSSLLPRAESVLPNLPRNVVAVNQSKDFSSKTLSDQSAWQSQSPKEQKLQNLASTGVPGFDIIAGGGIPRGRITMLSGRSGMGKTIFSAQFLLEGVKKNERGVFAITDDRPQEVLEEMESLGLHLVSAIQEKKIFLLVMDPKHEYHIKGIEVFNARNRNEFLTVLSKLSARHGIRRIAIDTLNPLIAERGASRVRKELSQIVDQVGNLGCTVLLAAEIPSASKELTPFGVEEHFVSGLVALKSTSARGQILRYLYISKLKGTEHRMLKYVYEIASNVGVRLLEPLQEHISQQSPLPRSDSGVDFLTAMRAFASLYGPMTSQGRNDLNFERGVVVERDEERRIISVPGYSSKPKRKDETEHKVQNVTIANQPKRKEQGDPKLTAAAIENPWTSIISERSPEESVNLADSSIAKAADSPGLEPADQSKKTLPST